VKKPKRLVVMIRVGAAVIIVAGIVTLWPRVRGAGVVSDVPVATAKQGDFAVLVRCRGSLTAAHKVNLTAPEDVSDLQIIWLAPAGGLLKAGAAVIRFDASKLQQDLREKTQALKQSQASLAQAEAQEQIDAGKDRLDLTQARADMEKARLEASKQAIVSSLQGQESAIDFDVAAEKVAVQQSATALHKESNDAKIASQKRLRDQAQSEVDLVKRRLALMEIKTPIAGIVTYLSNTTQGWMNAQNYKVGDHVSPGVTIAEIPDLNTLEMESKINEEDRGRIVVGDEVNVYVDALPEQTMHAKLTSISLLTEQSFDEWPPLHTFRAFSSLAHPDSRLRPGMNASAGIVERKLSNVVSVPSRALFTVEGKPAVYVKGARGFSAAAVVIQARNQDEAAVTGIPNGVVVALLRPEGQR
jgi:HlyD family secretion protein